MRMRVIIETDISDKLPMVDFRNRLRHVLISDELAKVIPGTIVYMASETVETAVLSHDGKMPTVG